MFLAFALLNGKINFAITFRDFKQVLLRGDFNLFLIRPIHPFLFLFSQRFNGANLLSGIVIVLPITILLSLFFEHIILGWILFIIGVIHCTVLFWFIELVAFFLKDNSFISTPIKRATWFFEEYVPLFLQNTSFFNILGVIPSVIFAFLAVDVMNGNFEYLFLLIASVISIPILSFFCIILWKFGIKKYEAYG
ncbi:MAG: ABC-2 family transporter protein [Nanoarchaeota archaeon]|nr:ABC-2 family transporter protein [Nanoarchaeota archaeon]